MEIEELIRIPAALPSIPRVIALLLNELNTDEPSLQKINSLLSEDPVMTARLLRLANSARFQLSRTISSASEAIAILGTSEVREVALSAALASVFNRVGGVYMVQFWRYSLNTAKLTRALYGLMPRNNVNPYTLGLIHAVGELVMHLGMPEQTALLDSKVEIFSPARARAEIDEFGYSYAQVGAAFAREWGLPDEMAQLLERLDNPYNLDQIDSQAAILHLAVWRCRAEECEYTLSDLLMSFPDDVAAAVKLDLPKVLEREPIQWTSLQEAGLFS